MATVISSEDDKALPIDITFLITLFIVSKALPPFTWLFPFTPTFFEP